jgi:predicted nucleotidyltransferase
VSTDADSVVDRLGQVLAASDEVRLAYLFGSRARGGARRDSDYDIGVLFDAAAAGGDQGAGDQGAVVRRLAGRLGRVVSSTLLDLVVLNDAPPLLSHRVLRDGVVLFQRSPEERVRFAIRTIREYQDAQIRRERFTRARIRRLEAGVTDGGSRDLLEKARGTARLLKQASRVP